MKKWMNALSQNRRLILTILVALIPLMGFRLIRMTGDEKVYLSQSLEMAQRGNWFVQVLADRPDYYKGPLHYILVRLGLMIFGQNLWAALYMNLIFCLLGALALAEWVRDAFPRQKYWPYWAGCFFAFNLGVYGHFFTSQMEVELAGLFSLAFLALWRRNDLLFWLVAGFAGWSKSPLHSVLLGLSALSYWGLEGTLLTRIRSMRAWIDLVLGVFLCSLGYAPAFFLDTQNFIQHYYLRETLKNGNGGAWWQSLAPMVSYYLLPWLSFALLSYAEFFRNWMKGLWRWSGLSHSERSLWKLVLSALLPTHLFFMVYHYRGENYAMPTVAASIFLVLLLKEKTDLKMIQWRKWILALCSLFGILIAAVFHKVGNQFQFSEGLWPVWFIPALWILSLFCIFTHFREVFSPKGEGLSPWITLGQVSFVSMLGLIFAVLGEMDIYSVRQQLREDQAQGVHSSISYLDIRDTIWNEWGLLSFSLGYPIQPIHYEAQLKQAIEEGHLILARNLAQREQILEFSKASVSSYQPRFYSWRRFKVIHADPKGIALLKKAWDERDFSFIMDEGVMMRFFPLGDEYQPQSQLRSN